MERDDLRLELSIDENNLLNEWKGQASLMLDYGIQLADAMQARDEAKAQLSVVAAEMETDIRNNPDEFDLEKVTEAVVAATVLLQPEHRKATKTYNKTCHECRKLQAVVDAISHRKSALQGMTDTFLRQWHADPRSTEQPRELREAAMSGPPTRSVAVRRRKRRAVES